MTEAESGVERMSESWEELVREAEKAVGSQRFGVAEALFERALQVARELPVPELNDALKDLGITEVQDTRPLLVSLTLEHLADLYSNWQKRAKAEELYKEVLALRLQHLGPDHHKLVRTHFDLATLYMSTGSYAEAEPHYIESIRVGKAALGPHDADVGSILHALGTLRVLQENYEQAVPPLREAIAVRSIQTPADHFGTMTSRNLLAESYEELGKPELALELYRQVLDAKIDTLGEHHLGLLGTLQHLSSLMEETEDFQAAKEFEQRALEIQQGRFDSSHPTLAGTFRNLGRLQVKLDDYTAAAANYEKAVQIASKGTQSEEAVAAVRDDLEYLIEIYDYLDDHERVAATTERLSKLRG